MSHSDVIIYAFSYVDYYTKCASTFAATEAVRLDICLNISLNIQEFSLLVDSSSNFFYFSKMLLYGYYSLSAR